MCVGLPACSVGYDRSNCMVTIIFIVNIGSAGQARVLEIVAIFVEWSR